MIGFNCDQVTYKQKKTLGFLWKVEYCHGMNTVCRKSSANVSCISTTGSGRLSYSELAAGFRDSYVVKYREPWKHGIYYCTDQATRDLVMN